MTIKDFYVWFFFNTIMNVYLDIFKVAINKTNVIHDIICLYVLYLLITGGFMWEFACVGFLLFGSETSTDH